MEYEKQKRIRRLFLNEESAFIKNTSEVCNFKKVTDCFNKKHKLRCAKFALERGKSFFYSISTLFRSNTTSVVSLTCLTAPSIETNQSQSNVTPPK